MDLIAVGLGHGDTEPSSRRRSLDLGSLYQNLIVEANLSYFTSNVHATVLRLQVDIEGVCGHVAGHLQVEDQLRVVITFIERESIPTLITLPDLAILHVDGRRIQVGRSCDKVVVIFEHRFFFLFLFLSCFFLLLLDIVLPALLSCVTGWLNTLLLIEFFLGATIFADLLELSLVFPKLCLGCKALRSGDFLAI